jgi:hypothetical protein
LELDDAGKIVRAIDIGAEICEHAFINGMLCILRGTEQSWSIARLDPRQELPEVIDLAAVPFACRSLTFDGELFWSKPSRRNQIVSFLLPT